MSLSTLRPRSSDVPTTTRSGCLKSRIAAPSRKNSGLDATTTSVLRIGLVDQPLDLVAGADRHGRLGDDHRKAGQRDSNFARGGGYVAQIGMATAPPRRCADVNETASASATGTARSVAKSSRPAFTLEATSSSSPGSKI